MEEQAKAPLPRPRRIVLLMIEVGVGALFASFMAVCLAILVVSAKLLAGAVATL